MILRITPLDPLHFRDGRPFDAALSSWSTSVFPPSPSVLYGAVRAIYFSQHPEMIELAGVQGDPTSGLKIRGIALGLKAERQASEVFYPIPRNCATQKNSLEINARASKPEKAESNPSSCPTEMVPVHSIAHPEEIDDGLVRSDELSKYLGGDEQVTFIRLRTYLLNETRIGIAVNRSSGVADEHMLYRASMVRTKGLNLLVDYEGLELPSGGIVKLGGEGRPAAYAIEPGSILPPCPIPSQSARLFRLYLSTPAVFDKGWLPSWIDAGSLKGSYSGMDLKLTAAAVGKPVSSGGFDIKRGPKPMYRLVPAGSVYWLELINGDMRNVFHLLHGMAISDRQSEQGYGIAFIGVC